MPYNSNDDLPPSVKDHLKDAKGRKLFRVVFNSEYRKHGNETISFASAWSALQTAGYKKTSSGTWVKADSKNSSVTKSARPQGVSQEIENWLQSNYGIDFDELTEEQEDNPYPGGVYSYMPLNQHSRDLLWNWIVQSGIPNPVGKDQLHSTIVFSKENFGGYHPKMDMTIVKPHLRDEFGFVHQGYHLKRMGSDKEAAVLVYHSPELECQFNQALRCGASWDWKDHGLHITLSYDAPEFDLSKLDPPQFEIVFEPEVVTELVENWADDEEPVLKANICKTDGGEQQMVYGWASVISLGDTEYFDLQNEAITEQALLDTAHEFMIKYREGRSQHQDDAEGVIVESMVFTKDLQMALGIDLGMVGWMIGYHVKDLKTWQDVKDGRFRAFSIGGVGITQPVLEE